MADKPTGRMKKNATKNSLNSLVTLNLSDLNKNQNGNMIIDKEADSNQYMAKRRCRYKLGIPNRRHSWTPPSMWCSAHEKY